MQPLETRLYMQSKLLRSAPAHRLQPFCRLEASLPPWPPPTHLVVPPSQHCRCRREDAARAGRLPLLLLALPQRWGRLQNREQPSHAAIVPRHHPQLVSCGGVFAAYQVVDAGRQRCAHQGRCCRRRELLPRVGNLCQRAVAACTPAAQGTELGSGQATTGAVSLEFACQRLTILPLLPPRAPPLSPPHPSAPLRPCPAHLLPHRRMPPPTPRGERSPCRCGTTACCPGGHKSQSVPLSCQC